VELPVHSARATLREPDKLGALEPTIGLTEQQRQHPLLNRSEEGVGHAGPARATERSHIGNDHTRFGNARKVGLPELVAEGGGICKKY
jgi:hypothetical protein